MTRRHRDFMPSQSPSETFRNTVFNAENILSYSSWSSTTQSRRERCSPLVLAPEKTTLKKTRTLALYPVSIYLIHQRRAVAQSNDFGFFGLQMITIVWFWNLKMESQTPTTSMPHMSMWVLRNMITDLPRREHYQSWSITGIYICGAFSFIKRPIFNSVEKYLK